MLIINKLSFIHLATESVHQLIYSWMYSNINLVRRPVSQLLLVNPLTFDMHNVIIIYQMLDEDTRSVLTVHFKFYPTLHCTLHNCRYITLHWYTFCQSNSQTSTILFSDKYKCYTDLRNISRTHVCFHIQYT